MGANTEEERQAVYARLEKLDEAVNAYQKMMDQKPTPQAYSRAAHMRWLTGDLDGAIQSMQMAVDASGSGDPESAAWFRVRLALYELQAGKFEKSSSLIEEAVDKIQPIEFKRLEIR